MMCNAIVLATLSGFGVTFFLGGAGAGRGCREED